MTGVGMIETSERAPCQILALRVHGWTGLCLRRKLHMSAVVTDYITRRLRDSKSRILEVGESSEVRL